MKRNTHVDIDLLRAFKVMVDLGTLTRAAEHLGIAQPSLSQQVQALETQFGVKLLTRTKQGVRPTTAGELLYRHAHIILQQFDQTKLELSDAGARLGGIVSVGLPGSLAQILTLPLLRAVGASHPGLSIRFVEGSHALLSELTANGRLDFALSSGEPMTGVSSELILTDQLVLISSAELSDGGSTVSIKDLDRHPLVLPTRTSSRPSRVHSAFALHGMIPHVVAELSSTYDLIRAVQEGIGSTVTGWVAADRFAAGLVVRQIVNPTIDRPIFIEEPASLPASASAVAVKALLRDLMIQMVEDGQWRGATLAVPRHS